MTLKFPENREKFLGLGEAASGIGFMAGPAIGCLLFNAFGFCWAFLSFSIFLTFTGALCLYNLPSSLNSSDPVEIDENATIGSEAE